MKNRFRKKFTGTPHVLGSGASEGDGASNQQALIEKLEAKKKKAPPRVSLTQHLQECEESRRNAPLQFSQDVPTPIEEEPADEEEMEFQISVLLSTDSSELAVGLLKRVLRNLISQPNETKFQKLNLENPKVKGGIVDIPGALDFMRLCDFVQKEEQLVYEGHPVMGKPRRGLEHLCRHFPDPPPPAVEPVKAVAVTSSTETLVPEASAADVPQRERQTQLVLMKPTNDAVPDWFFNRTSAEVKAQYFEMLRKKEQDETFMTRAQREKLKGPVTQYTYAVIRVRLPEGVLVQGEFDARESVVRIHEWVTEQLRDATRPFELALPSRDKLGLVGTVKKNQLMPATLLSFRWSDGLGMVNTEPTVKDALLDCATVDWQPGNAIN